MPLVFARLNHVIEVGARLYHCCATHSLTRDNHQDTHCHDPGWVNVRLVTGEAVRGNDCLGKSHGVGHAVLVAIGEKKRCDLGDWSIVRGRRVKLEEVEERKGA